MTYRILTPHPGNEVFHQAVNHLANRSVIISTWHHARPQAGHPAVGCVGEFGTVRVEVTLFHPADQDTYIESVARQADTHFITLVWHDDFGFIAVHPTNETGRILRPVQEVA